MTYAELPPAMNVTEVAQILGVGERAVRQAINRGELGSFRVGRFVKVGRHHLADFIGYKNGASSPADAAPHSTSTPPPERESRHVRR